MVCPDDTHAHRIGMPTRPLSRLLVPAALGLALLAPLPAEAASCPTTYCPAPGAVPYQGGAVISKPTVYIAAFSGSHAHLTDARALPVALGSRSWRALVAAALSGPDAAWWMSEYGGSSPISPGVFARAISIYAPSLVNAPAITQGALESALRGANIPTGPDVIIAIVLRDYQYLKFPGLTRAPCGFHGYLPSRGLAYAVTSAGPSAGCYPLGLTAPALADVDVLLAHELIEATTDPGLPRAWAGSDATEVVDPCEQAPARRLSTPYGAAWVPSVYSNTIGGCFSGPVATTLTAASGALALYGGRQPLAGLTVTVDGVAYVTDAEGDISVPGGPLTASFSGLGPLLPAVLSQP